MRQRQVVVGDARMRAFKWVHVVKADVAREEVEHLRQLQMRAASPRSVRICPVRTALPVRALELMGA